MSMLVPMPMSMLVPMPMPMPIAKVREVEIVYIEKISEYMEFVEGLPGGFELSRGQKQQYKLLPGGLREDNTGIRKYSKRVCTFFLEEFKTNSHSYLKTPFSIQNQNEWMLMAQHYGIPTYLLDFTYSHIVSLMFAVEDAFTAGEEHDAEVWFLDPLALNLKYAKRQEVINFSVETHFQFGDLDGPVAVKGRKINDRINSQNGLFVYFQQESVSLDMLADCDQLRKIVIKGPNKKDILSSLNAMGIGFTSIYPELDSVSKDIILKNDILEYQKNK